jgi:hypothetical protein
VGSPPPHSAEKQNAPEKTVNRLSTPPNAVAALRVTDACGFIPATHGRSSLSRSAEALVTFTGASDLEARRLYPQPSLRLVEGEIPAIRLVEPTLGMAESQLSTEILPLYSHCRPDSAPPTQNYSKVF